MSLDMDWENLFFVVFSSLDFRFVSFVCVVRKEYVSFSGFGKKDNKFTFHLCVRKEFGGLFKNNEVIIV